MFKRFLSLTICSVLIIALLAACGANNNNTGANTGANTGTDTGTNTGTDTATPDAEPATIYMFINQPEYTDAFNAFVAEYKKVKPNVTIQLEIMQADYPTILKSKIASGSIPDVFASTAGGEIKLYSEYTADLTNEPLAAVMDDAAKGNMSYDGKVYGIPIKGNLFNMIYNKKIFADLGIEAPKTTTELKDVITKIEAAGITPFAYAYKEWWVQKHIFQHFINAETDDAEALVNEFIAGTTTFAEHPELLNFFDFVDLTVKHGMSKPLERDYSAGIADFASGKAAMMVGQGAWVEEGIMQIAPDMQIGVMGYPVNEDPTDAMIITGADQALRINKDSKVLQETIDFFNWLYTSDYGKSWFSDVAKVIPPLKGVPYPELQMPQQMKAIVESGEKTGDLAVAYSLDSFHQKFGEIMQAYIVGGPGTRDRAIEDIEKAWIQLGAPK